MDDVDVMSQDKEMNGIAKMGGMAMDTMKKDSTSRRTVSGSARKGREVGAGATGWPHEAPRGGAIPVVRFRMLSRKTFSPAGQRHRQLSLFAVLLVVMACNERNRTPTGPSPADGIRDSAALFQLITQTDPLTEYALFPNAEEFTVGRLNGSEAHRSIVRVSMNARALGALQSGRLPTAAQFPDGSIILKEIRPRADAPVTVYAVMYKDAGHTLAGDRWL
jgi:hypothetical protein